METIAIILLAATLVFTTSTSVRSMLSSRTEALSMKVIFLLGFAFFQLLSGIFSLVTGQTDFLYAQQPGVPAVIFALLSILFLTVFLFAYRQGWGVRKLATRPERYRPTTCQGLVASSVISLVLAFVCRDLIGTTIPVLGVLTFQLASGMYVAAVGFAAWAWFEFPKRIVTALWLGTTLTLVVAAFLSVEWSRRGMISTFLAVPWVGYYCSWRYLPRSTFAKWFIVISILGLIPVTFQSALRGGAQEQDTKSMGGISGYVNALARTSPSDYLNSFFEYAAGQFAGSNSMWLIDEYPRSFPHTPFHQLYYLAVHPVPRLLWEDKPVALGREMVIIGQIRGVAREHSLGPGIIGHCWVDVWWLAIPAYAALLGLWFRYLDERAACCASLPYVVIPIGACTAHVFGIPRGETALFAFNAIAALAGAVVAARLSGYVFAKPTDLILFNGTGHDDHHGRSPDETALS